MPKSLTELVHSIAADPNAITGTEAEKIIKSLRPKKSLGLSSKLSKITMDPGIASPHASKALINRFAAEFFALVPSVYGSYLPKFEIKVVPPRGTVLGSYNPDTNILILTDTRHPDALKKTIFHELAHWMHLGGKQELQVYRDRIKAHFDIRTKGESSMQLPGYSIEAKGKKDLFWDPYLGREYKGVPDGCEIPPRTFELLTKPFAFAGNWNNLTHRETLDIVFSVLFA